MAIYTTLKANKEHGITGADLYIYYEECYGCAGELFGEDYWDWDKWETDKISNDKVFDDFTDRQIASTVLKGFKAMAKDKEEPLMIWNKIFWDTDLPEVCYEQIIELIKAGEITGSNQLKELDRKARKNGCTIKKEICYDTENHYYTMSYISDIIEEYYPCNYDIAGDCNNCGNCH